MDSNHLIFGISILVVIVIGLIFSKNLKAIFSDKGLEIEKSEGKDNVQVTQIRNKSEVDLNTKENQNVNVKDIDDSKVRINK